MAIIPKKVVIDVMRPEWAGAMLNMLVKKPAIPAEKVAPKNSKKMTPNPSIRSLRTIEGQQKSGPRHPITIYRIRETEKS